MKPLNFKIGILLIFLLSFFNLDTKAQDKDDIPIKVNTLLVNVPVIVSDRGGRYISGLKKENFFIIQDEVEQKVEFFADEEAPMNVLILIDNSPSTTTVLGNIINAARNFVKIFRPEDKAMIATFNADTKILCEFTSDQKNLSKAINKVDIDHRGGSNMQDAIYSIVTKEFASVKGRKAIIVLTDGAVGGRLISNEKLLNTLAEADTLVYPVIFELEDFIGSINIPKKVKLVNGETISREEFLRRRQDGINRHNQFLNSLGTVTGGRLFNSNDFKKSFQSIADELKKQYLVGFYPQNADDGKNHKIVVEVDLKDVVVRTKGFIKINSAKKENQ